MAHSARKLGAVPVVMAGAAFSSKGGGKSVSADKLLGAAKQLRPHVKDALERATSSKSLNAALHRRRSKGLSHKLMSGARDVDKVLKVVGTLGAIAGAVTTSAEVLVRAPKDKWTRHPSWSRRRFVEQCQGAQHGKPGGFERECANRLGTNYWFFETARQSDSQTVEWSFQGAHQDDCD
jgi:hypothetical protein